MRVKVRVRVRVRVRVKVRVRVRYVTIDDPFGAENSMIVVLT